MRHNWNYKTIGDVCTSVTDGSHNPPKGIDKSDYRMISSQNIFDDNLILTDDSVRYLSKENHIIEDKRTRLQKDVVLLTIVGTIGRACILTGNEGPLTLQRSVAALHPSEEILPRFLLHTLIGNRTTLNQEAHGIAQKGLYLKQLSALRIPVPTIEEQQKIVSELDKINELIRLKKEQLKDYDNLAQSIFYEMFGDPVVNEKGWEVKKLGEVAMIKTGPFGSMLHKEDYITGGIPLINPMHIQNFKAVPDKYFTISKEKAAELCDYQLKINDVIFARRGDIGRCAVISDKEAGYLCGTGSLFVRFERKLSSIYTMYVVRTTSFIKELVSKAKGATMLNLNSSTMENLRFPIPPLPLQQAFAQRIELIEQQKAEIQNTIADLETLLASRMQYWFD